MTNLQLCVLIDYQNIHLTARDVFAPYGTKAQDTLVHPLKFAERLLVVRAAAQGDEKQAAAELASVRVFRGVPTNKRQSDLYRAAQMQRAEWTRDRRVGVNYRSLKYPPGWPTARAQEKGVDVRLAIELVSLALAGTYDVLVLAAHDTDQEPALEMADETGHSKIETAGWVGCKVLRLPTRSFWHTTLDSVDYMESRDRRDYWGQRR